MNRTLEPLVLWTRVVHRPRKTKCFNDVVKVVSLLGPTTANPENRKVCFGAYPQPFSMEDHRMIPSWEAVRWVMIQTFRLRYATQVFPMPRLGSDSESIFPVERLTRRMGLANVILVSTYHQFSLHSLEFELLYLTRGTKTVTNPKRSSQPPPPQSPSNSQEMRNSSSRMRRRSCKPDSLPHRLI